MSDDEPADLTDFGALTVTDLERGAIDIALNDIPQELRDRDQWLNWDADADRPRRPCVGSDFHISWNEPDDWLTFEEAVDLARNKASRGIGYVFSNGLDEHGRGVFGALDLDGVFDDDGHPVDWLPSLHCFAEHDAYIEISPSGEGLHIPLAGFEPPEWWRDVHQTDDEHEGVEAYGGKFMTVTGDRQRGAGWEIPDAGDWVDRWLRETYKSLTGDDPVSDGSDSGDYSSGEHGDDWLDQGDIREALDHIDPDCGYTLWRDIAFALVDFFEGDDVALEVFLDWSRDGSKFDRDAQRRAERIIDDADANGQRTVGTIIHHATESGWTPPDPPDDTPEPAPEPQTDGAGSPGWDAIYESYLAAEDTDERQRARYQAVQKLDTDKHWRNVIETDHLWFWDAGGGRYRMNGEAVVRQELVGGIRDQFRDQEKSEAVVQLQGRNPVREEQMGGPAGAINCQNGVIRVGPDGVEGPEPANPDDEWLTSLSTSYDPDAECPQFREFLSDVVPEGRERSKLQEFAGYALMHWALPYHKALFLVGPTASGKSTFLDTIRALFGSEAVASLTPQEMVEQRFAGAELYGSWANIRNDIPADTVEKTGTFKELVAGDPVKAEQKFEDPFFFEPTAKHMFSANQLPDTDTDDQAFYRRILLCAFPSTVPRDQRDPMLDDKLRRELPGVLNWALDGLQRLMDQGRFTGDRMPGETADTWRKWGEPVDRFEADCLTDGDREIPKDQLHSAYLAYCEDEGIPSQNQHKMTRALKADDYEDGRAYVNGKRQRCFLNIDLTGRGEQYLPDDDSHDRDGQARL